MATAVVSAELVAPVANMLAAAFAAGRVGQITGQTGQAGVQTIVSGPPPVVADLSVPDGLASTRAEEVEGERAEQDSATHLDRAAVIYVRQSTLAQVREHTESTMRQYALAEEAVRLGWAAGSVEVIDADLGSRAALPRAGTGSRRWSPGCAWARSARCSGWRSPGWPARRRICPGCWSWPG